MTSGASLLMAGPDPESRLGRRGAGPGESTPPTNYFWSLNRIDVFDAPPWWKNTVPTNSPDCPFWSPAN